VARCPRWKAGCCADVGNGGALIESRRGMFEVYPASRFRSRRVDAIRKQDGPLGGGHQQGLIVATLTPRVSGRCYASPENHEATVLSSLHRDVNPGLLLE